MNQNELQTNTNEINDLTVAETEQAEVKGGPKRIFIGGLSAKATATSLPDLEPQGDVVGGLLLPAVHAAREAARSGGGGAGKVSMNDISI
jgi:hypothetical protein